MAASASDYFMKAGNSTATTLAAPGHTSGGTTITVGSTANWPTDTGVTFAIDSVTLVGGEEVQTAGTYTVWRGTVSGSTITSMVLDSSSPNSDQNYAAGSLTRVYIPVSSGLHNRQVTGLLVAHDQDGTLKAGAVDGTTVIADNIITPAKLTDELQNGWVVGELPAVSSVTNNGNGSEDITFTSTVASILSPGMRIRTTRTVAAPTYMGGAFNGSSHYFTRTSANLGSTSLATVTNNFTIRATIEPTSYPAYGTIVARMDSGAANGFALEMYNSTGQIRIIVQNGGAANYTLRASYQSVPLNKKTRITATWASGTVVLYFNGVAVPTFLINSGTLPTTAGTGGDFSIGRQGAAGAGYFPGYISEVSVFDAVLSEATIRQYDTYSLSGSETNCIGAWDLNNRATDQSSAGNNLTATGGVGYTSGKAPYATDGNGVSGGTYDYGLVMAVSTTTATIQFPEACSAPVSGGISAVAYSVQKSPYGFPAQQNRWELRTLIMPTVTQASPVNGTWYNLSSAQLSVPIGAWSAGYYTNNLVINSTNANSLYATLSTANNSESDKEYTNRVVYGAANAVGIAGSTTKTKAINLTVATPLYLNSKTDVASCSGIYINPSGECSLITAIPSNL